jgi:hypothetical protein
MNQNLTDDQDSLPHFTNIERLERRIFEVHTYWRHNITLVTFGFAGFLAAHLGLALWFVPTLEKSSMTQSYFLCVVALVMASSIFIAARALSVARESLKKSDRNINALEEEIQRITSSTGYILNKEVMPLDFFLKNLTLMRTLVFLLLLIWVALPVLALVRQADPPTTPTAKKSLTRPQEQPKRGKN